MVGVTLFQRLRLGVSRAGAGPLEPGRSSRGVFRPSGGRGDRVFPACSRVALLGDQGAAGEGVNRIQAVSRLGGTGGVTPRVVPAANPSLITGDRGSRLLKRDFQVSVGSSPQQPEAGREEEIPHSTEEAWEW